MSEKPGDRHESARRAMEPGAPLAAGVLALAFVILTCLAPAGNPLAPPSGLVDRLFPGVSPAWALGRLVCLTLGVGWLLARVRAPLPLAPRPEPTPGGAGAPLVWLVLAGGASVTTALAWTRRADFGPLLQLGWLLSLMLPGLLVWLGSKRSPSLGAEGRPPSPGADARTGLGPLLVGLLFVATTVGVGGGDVRPASLVDLWQSFDWLQASLAAGTNPLLQSGQPGIANVYMLLTGYPWLFDGGGDDFRRLQWVHALWLCLAAAGVATLLREVLPRHPASLAVATFLFSPFVLALAQSPSPFGIFLAIGAAALSLVARSLRTGAPAALVGAASLLGLGVMSAYLWPWIAVAGGVCALAWLRRAPRSPAVAVVALLAFGAAALPSAPSLRTAAEMPHLYGERTGPWTTLEALLLGQHRADFQDPEGLWSGDPAERLERAAGIALGAALSPFAAPRTPLRLWLDGLFDPVSTWLAALGLGGALLAARRSREARRLLALLAVALLPAALASAYDRTSLLRNLLLPIPVALLAAHGFRQAAARIGVGTKDARRLHAAAVVGVVAGGLFVFDVWTPRRLPESSTAIALEALRGQPPGSGRIWLDFGVPAPLEFLYTETILGQLATGAFHVIPWTGPRSLDAVAGVVPPELVFWSAGLETQHGIGRALCARWPTGSVYPLVGRSGHSRAFAIEPGAVASWTPALPAGRSARISCADLAALLATEGAAPGSAAAREPGGNTP